MNDTVSGEKWLFRSYKPTGIPDELDMVCKKRRSKVWTRIIKIK